MVRFYDVNGIRTRVLELGEGEPIILLHGWGTKIESLFPISSFLQTDMKVIIMDFPGFGQTDFPPAPWGVSDYVDWLRSLLHILKIDSAYFLGHSFGGRVGIKLAASAPEIVKGLILVDSAGVRQFETSWRTKILGAISGVAKPFLYLLPGSLSNKIRWKFYKSIGSTDYLTAGRLRETYLKVINEDLEPLLGNICAPTLLVWGEKDQATPLKDGELMARKITGSKLIVIKDAGHYPFVDNPIEVNKYIAEYLKQPEKLL
jgi:pimeloyl-ACP methyl ester carboxylesterase